MARVKPIIPTTTVLALLADTFNRPITDLAPLDGGQIARAFSFLAGDERLVIRLAEAHMVGGYEKEAFIAREFRSARVPMPEVLRVGVSGEHCYAISRFMDGTRLDLLDEAAYAAVFPSLLTTTDAIREIDVSAWRGWGDIRGDGCGEHSRWTDWLVAVRDEQPEPSFYGRWHRLFRESFLECDVFERVYAELERLLPYLPEERHLVHTDMGFGNALAEGTRITAVLDWANATYGDFLFDVAWLHFFPSSEDAAARFRAHYAAIGLAVPHFEERLRCYLCRIGLDSMRYWAHTEQRAAYDWGRDRLLGLLSATADDG